MADTLLVLGLGYSATAVVRHLRHRFKAVTATRRPGSPAPDPALAAAMLDFDGAADRPRAALVAAVRAASHVLVSIPPDAQGDPVLRHLGEALGQADHLAWIGYLSTVGVYGDAGGAWVDEASPLRATAERGRRRIGVEADWLDFGERAGVPVQVLRLSGIYGPGRGPLDNVRAGTAHRIIKSDQVFNRIHVDDIAGAVAAGIDRPVAGPVNVSDDEPAPPQDVIVHAAGLLGVPPPPAVSFERAELSAMARSFYSENRRVSNRRLREVLGYTLAYPTYREGLAACLAARPA